MDPSNEAAGTHRHPHPHHPHPQPRSEVKVSYNGMPKDIPFDAKETVKALLDRAIQAFGSLPNPHTLALYTAEGRELPDASTLKDEGVKAGDCLLLRPSTVKGG